jgi:hypothetical protein
MEPMSRSAKQFCQGLCGAVRNLLDSHALHAMPELLTVDLVTIPEEIGGGGLVRAWRRRAVGRPGGGGMLGDVEVDYAPAAVGKHNENEQDTEANGGHGEEVDRDEVADVIGKERPPSLGRRGAPLRD